VSRPASRGITMLNQGDVDEPSDRLGGRTEPASVDSPGRNPLPSLVILLTGAITLGAIGGYFLTPRGAEPPLPVVAMISPEEIPEAIMTLNPGAQQNAQSDSRGCRFPMGFLTVATPGNPAGGTVRFRTSKYRSPPFQVTDKPQRIAIPHPLPETGGIDLLSADGDAKGLVVALYPTTRMEPINGTATVKVRWRPRPLCKS
jgi:hypothetical protein